MGHGLDPGTWPLSGGELLAAAGLAAAASAYCWGAAVHRRGPSWPVHRTMLWLAGIAVTGAALVGPLPRQAHHDFTVHMLGHVLLGMLGPLLLVLAAPVTLALRALPLHWARRSARLLRSAPVVALTHPVIAALLNVGGLWVLYRTGMYAAMLQDTGVHVAVHAHVFAAGYLFTHAMIGPDPAPHRGTHAMRAAVLVLALAAHNILAKTLYAHPPPHVSADQAHTASQLMYYGGAPIEVALIVLLCHHWAACARHRGDSRPAPR